MSSSCLLSERSMIYHPHTSLKHALQHVTRRERAGGDRLSNCWAALVRKRSYITILLALFVAASGCRRGPQFAPKLQAAGGAAPLKQECANYLRLYEQTLGQQYVWLPHTTNFSPAIASFQPQAVSITRLDDVLLIDVHVTGGFNHHGILVAPLPTPHGFQPRRGNWSIWQLADGVWEYRE